MRAINIAHNPGVSIFTLFGLQTANSSFQPSISAAPNDVTLALSDTSGLNTGYSMAVDAAGNIWTVNLNGNNLVGFSPTGAILSGDSGDYGFTGGGLANPSGIAIDGSGNVWLLSVLGNTLTEFVGAASPVVTPIAANLISPYGGHAVNKP